MQWFGMFQKWLGEKSPWLRTHLGAACCLFYNTPVLRSAEFRGHKVSEVLLNGNH